MRHDSRKASCELCLQTQRRLSELISFLFYLAALVDRRRWLIGVRGGTAAVGWFAMSECRNQEAASAHTCMKQKRANLRGSRLFGGLQLLNRDSFRSSLCGELATATLRAHFTRSDIGRAVRRVLWRYEYSSKSSDTGRFFITSPCTSLSSEMMSDTRIGDLRAGFSSRTMRATGPGFGATVRISRKNESWQMSGDLEDT